jgi:hypothetical protein
MAKKERNRGSVDRARAKRATPPNNERRERVGQVLLRRLLDRGETETPPMRFRDLPPEMRFMDVPSTMPAGTPGPAVTRPTPRPARASNLAPTSTRDKPVPRPAGLAERADLRKAMDSSDAAFRASKREAADREMGMKAGGKVKKMQAGGKCRGMGAATRGGNFSRG